ncbi:hypothetical protein ACWDQO_32585 [Streptomyces sp. NPDC003703]|uniref:hypothetical protein n=1 Tax=Streptomyces sp. NPDC003283 TaxID=3364681 RepID=UPI0036AAC9C9
MEITTGKLRRLRSGPGTEDDDEPRPFLVRLRFTAEDPAQVIDNARAVLTCVVSQMGDWPAEELWPQLLPAWFIQRWAPEPPEPEDGEPFDMEAWLRQWRAMTPEERAAADGGPWTLWGWLYYFDPTEEGMGDDRSWWWCHAGTGESGGWVAAWISSTGHKQRLAVIATYGWSTRRRVAWSAQANAMSILAASPREGGESTVGPGSPSRTRY